LAARRTLLATKSKSAANHPLTSAAVAVKRWLMQLSAWLPTRATIAAKPVKPGVTYLSPPTCGGLPKSRAHRGFPAVSLAHIRARLYRVDPEQQTMHVRDLDHGLPISRLRAAGLVATLFRYLLTLALALAAVGLFTGFAYEWRRAPTNSASALPWVQSFRVIAHRPVVRRLQTRRGVGRGILLSNCLRQNCPPKWVTKLTLTR